MARKARTAPAQPTLGASAELKQRLLFVLLALIVFRLGSFIPVPGIDPVATGSDLHLLTVPRLHEELNRAGAGECVEELTDPGELLMVDHRYFPVNPQDCDVRAMHGSAHVQTACEGDPELARHVHVHEVRV